MAIQYLTSKVSKHPSILVIASFALIDIIGTFLLLLPWMHIKNISPLDAFFTATSAVCVTGLTVVDTASAFTPLGHLVIMLLIEIGGLGVMTFSVLFAIALKRDIGLSSRFVVQEGFLHMRVPNINNVVKMIIFYALWVEILVTLALTIFFSKKFPVEEAFFYACFHSVSAFCNAGFSTLPAGLTAFKENWGVCLTIMIAILLGNSGFSVFYELKEKILKREKRPLSLHLKLTLIVHLGLILFGTVAILFTEANGILKEFSPLNKLLLASFHSVSARTAGFNTIAISDLTEDSLYILIILMFIGACPGSTGGGIKTTTISLLFVAAISRIRGFTKAVAFEKTIPEEAVQKATALFILSIVTLFIAHALMMFAGPNLPFRASHSEFLAYLFETVSGLGTVGLSVGITNNLGDFGKIIMILIMFIGRVGLLSFVSILTMAGKTPKSYHYPSENIMIG